MMRPRVLVVDDEREIRESIADHLRLRLDCDVVSKASGMEAIQALDSQDFHVLLQDLHMPGIDGYTVLRHARKCFPELIMIVITRLNSSHEIKMVEDFGATYLAKPVELKTVQMVVERRLQQKGGFDYRKSP